MPTAKPKTTIQNTIKKGRSITQIKNLHNLTPHQEEQKIKQILAKLVQDEDLLNILTQEENMKKLVGRFEYKANLIGEEAKVLANITHVGRKTPRTVYKELRNITKQNMKIESTALNQSLPQQFKISGYKFTPYTTGTLKRIEITTIFRKNK